MALSGGFKVWGREKGLLAKSFYYVSMATKNRIATTLRESCFFTGFAGRYGLRD